MSKLPAVVLVCSFLIASSVIVLSARESASDGLSRFLPAFQSELQLRQFIEDSASGHYLGNATFGSSGSELRQTFDMSKATHSETNIQVAGVDEADIVKTDGRYIYVASTDRVTVIDAYPAADLSNVSCIHADDLSDPIVPGTYASVWGLFVTDHDLVIIWTMSGPYSQRVDFYPSVDLVKVPQSPATVISLVDLEDIAHPSVRTSVGISGYPMAARMMGDLVYLVTQDSVWWMEDVRVPQIWTGSSHQEMSFERIHYDPETADANSFVNILTLDTSSGGSDSVSVLAGWSGTVYMSQTALYLTFPKYQWEGVMIMAGGQDTGHTTIYKLAADGLKMSAVARGDVAGYLNDQYSMDEYEGLLRVTTTNSWSARACNVFVMNETLTVIGSIEGLAERETVMASRFVGDTLYLVTFRSIDPLFVIDLKQPTQPTILGELTLPGFSSYIQPVDENHLLGIGTENGSAKLSLFDVTDPFHPFEVTKYVIQGDSWTDAASDPKAVLFDKEKELLVLPIHTYFYEYCYTSGSSTSSSESYAGVFRITSESLELRGKISHDEQGTLGYYSQYGYYTYYGPEIRRSLYIADCLYTISQTVVKANNLSNLSPAGSLVYFQMSPPTLPEPIPVYTNMTTPEPAPVYTNRTV